MQQNSWTLHQRVMSPLEPELGVGSVITVEQMQGYLEVYFSTSQEKRRYGLTKAPLQRLKLEIGDWAYIDKDRRFRIESLQNIQGLYKYKGQGMEAWEQELHWQLESSSSSPVLQNFFNKHWSGLGAYELRKSAWGLKSLHLSLPSKGLLGARISPIPHQLYIAHEVSRRYRPRVLLADEVGLGKTIESCLIFSALKVLGRADKVLIVVPNSLVHQWMFELYRKFSELFTILDEDRCLEEEETSNLSSFENHQHIIVSMDFLAQNKARLAQALAIDWDLIIIDEAHKLEWDPEQISPLWLIAKSLSEQTKSLLLLTATPNQRGISTQFGLLHLVDPDRYHDFDLFYDEYFRMQEVAECAEKVFSQKVDAACLKILHELFVDDEPIKALLSQLKKTESSTELRDQVLRELIDRHGTGRVYFRNRRARLKGFPKRILIDVPLAPSKAYLSHLQNIDPEQLDPRYLMDYGTGRGHSRSYEDSPSRDPRLKWLKEFIAALDKEKALVICHSQQRAETVAAYLEKSYPGAVALFHEGLDLVTRDHAAAQFARPQGAKILICSEIGGEGRNFQFVKKLVLLDIPMHPDLFEQRVGRLDRIGQGKEIEIYLPWLEHTPETVLLQWYRDALSIHEGNGFGVLLEELGQEILETIACFFPHHSQHEQAPKKLAHLIQATKTLKLKMHDEFTKNTDILVDLNSFDEVKGLMLDQNIEECDDNTDLEFFMFSVMNHFGIDYDDFDDHGSFIIKSDSLSFIDHFPDLSAEEDKAFTFDRRLALQREDIRFLTLDHPMVESILSFILHRGEGMASVCKWPKSPLGRGLLLNVFFVLEPQGPKELELGRFLPLSTFELLMDSRGQILNLSISKMEEALVPWEEDEMLRGLESIRPLINQFTQKATDEANAWSQKQVELSLQKAHSEYETMIARMSYLSQVNETIDRREYVYLLECKEQIQSALKNCKPRLDSIRLILTTV